MKYIPSYTCIYFDILLTSDLSEVSGFQMSGTGSGHESGAVAAERPVPYHDRDGSEIRSKFWPCSR